METKCGKMNKNGYSMPEKINSISFHEDFVLWTEFNKDGSKIGLNSAVSDSLPRILDHQTLLDPKVLNEFVDLINLLRESHQFNAKPTRISLSNKFSLIKKIQVDHTIPSDRFNEIILFEFEKSWQESLKNFQIYMVESTKASSTSTELLVVAIRKKVLEFFQNLVEASNLEAELITPSCFTMDEFYRKLHPNSTGPDLLLGWQRRGYDILISDQNHLINYAFKAYNSNMDSIEQIDEDNLISSFENLIEEIQHPSMLTKPLYDIKSIYMYGFHFRPEWLELVRAQSQIPVEIFDFNSNSSFPISIDNSEILKDRIYQFMEPISNIL
jgi:hypothetical protein